MPDTGAPWNIPYAAPADLVRDWPDLSEDVADAVAAGLTAAAGLVAVVQAVKSDTQASSLAAGAAIAISDLSITHSVAADTNKVFLIVSVVGENAAPDRSFGVRLMANSTAIGIGDASGSRPRVTAAANAAAVKALGTAAAAFLYTPGVTTAVTYSVDLLNLDTFTLTNYVNRTVDDENSARGPRAVSSLTLLEVKV
jgi:hypothetical protein